MSSELTDLKYQIGEYVLWLEDGDIGLIIDVDNCTDEPYNVDWLFNPGQSGWTSPYSDSHGAEPSMVVLGGE